MPRAVLLALALTLTTTLIAQSPAFDVISIKPRAADPRTPGGAPRGLVGGRYRAQNVSVRPLIELAFELQDVQIIGSPRWTSEARFDIEATTSPDVTAPQARAMLRTLLAQRFGLVSHTETRELQVYLLRIASPDGKLGPQLQRSGPQCRELAMPRNVPLPPPPPGPPPGSGGPPPLLLGGAPTRCPTLFVTMANASHLTSRELTIDTLARRLTQLLGRLVADRTGLEGLFDVDLTYASESQALATGADAPTLTTAVQEQLGLKLESSRARVDVLVIDRVEPPSEN